MAPVSAIGGLLLVPQTKTACGDMVGLFGNMAVVICSIFGERCHTIDTAYPHASPSPEVVLGGTYLLFCERGSARRSLVDFVRYSWSYMDLRKVRYLGKK
jgi:hypothetical protein